MRGRLWRARVSAERNRVKMQRSRERLTALRQARKQAGPAGEGER
jgi:hypothetical protein